jgi:hypothetical protein
MKTDGRLDRNFLLGQVGDAINALLAAVGHNLRLVLAALALWLAFILAAIAKPIANANTSGRRLTYPQIRAAWETVQRTKASKSTGGGNPTRSRLMLPCRFIRH